MPPKPRPGREVVPGHGLLIAGHAPDPDAVETEVAAWLAERVTDPWRRRELRGRLSQPGQITRAHWAGPEVGFCGPGHPQAEQVTIVHLPDDVTAP